MGPPKVSDYFAEMYVAGLLAEAGWNIYFPKRDQGFDMIATLPTPRGIVVRPIQVKGKYPQGDQPRKRVRYGFRSPELERPKGVRTDLYRLAAALRAEEFTRETQVVQVRASQD